MVYKSNTNLWSHRKVQLITFIENSHIYIIN